MADVDLCKVPLSEMSQEQRMEALRQDDERREVIKRENEEYMLTRPVSDICAPMVISDSMGDIKNPVDGKIYDSKSSYHRTIRRAGCHIHEGAPKKQQGDHNVAPELKQAIQQYL